MSGDLDIRLLRSFVVVAQELHFGRAARRLFLAQQALSRDIQRLEERVGAPLLERTTRRVVLTPAGEHLLLPARQLLALHDETLHELRDDGTAMLVNVVAQGLTPARVLSVARHRDPDIEFFARFHAGLEDGLSAVLAYRLDVTFGRWCEPKLGSVRGIEHRLVRREPISLLLPVRHPLAACPEVPLAALHGAAACWRAGDHVTPEWEDVARQLLSTTGAVTDAEIGHPHVRGVDELAHHVRSRNTPVLTLDSQPAVPGAVVRPLVAPRPLYPWSMIWRRSDRRVGIRVLQDAAAELAAVEGWPDEPREAWLPEPEASQRSSTIDIRSR